MRTHYDLYEGRAPVPREEVASLISEYNRAIRSDPFPRYQHIVRMIPEKAGRVLDYGCGWGCITKAIAEKGNTVVGIDQFDGALDVARDFNSHPDVEYSNQGIATFDEETFDLVNSNQVLEHVHNPGIYLQNVNRVLKPEGSLVISVPNIVNLYQLALSLRWKDHTARFQELSSDVLGNYRKDYQHVQGWTPKDFVVLHASLGFEYMEHKFVGGVHMPSMRLKHTKVPWGGTYWHTKISRLTNLSYTMLFRFRKIAHIDRGICS